MTTDKSALLPCVACGHDDLEPFSGWLTRCKWCGHTASTKTWNTRTPSKDAAEGEAQLQQAAKNWNDNAIIRALNNPDDLNSANLYAFVRGARDFILTPAAPAQDGLREAAEGALARLRVVHIGNTTDHSLPGGWDCNQEIRALETALAALSPKPSLGEKPQ